jgi:serine/threonine protein kinase
VLHVRKHHAHYIVKTGRKFQSEMQFFLMGLRHHNVIRPVQMLFTESFMCVIFPVYTVFSKALANDFTNNIRSVKRFLSMTQDIARGVQFLHDNGIAHMDIKPDNLVYDKDYVVRIIDFDLAVCVRNDEQLVYGMRGTLLWMAPGLFSDAITLLV